MDIETQLINELAENGTDKARELFLKWQEQRIKAKERLIEKLNAANSNCDLPDVKRRSEQFSLADMKEAYEAGENNAGNYTYPPFEEWFSKR